MHSSDPALFCALGGAHAILMVRLMIHLAPAMGRPIAGKGVGLWVWMLKMHKAWVTRNFHKVLIAMRIFSMAMHTMHISATC